MSKDNSLEKLLSQAKIQLKKEKAPEYLWQGISDEIDCAKNKKSPVIITILFDLVNNPLFRKRAFVFVAATILGLFIVKTMLDPQLITIVQTERLAKKLDNNIYLEHERYEKVINEFDINYLDQNITSVDGQTFLFVERLISLDNAINRCKSALELNPYSVAVNTSLISAYQDKISTLDQLNNIFRRIS